MHDTQNSKPVDAVPDSSGDQGAVSVAKFTPGPWKIEEDGWQGCWEISANSHRRWLALVGAVKDGAEFSRPNAHLIAAAPEMYEALKQAEEWLFGWKSAVPQLAVIQAALAKAEGRS